MKAKTRIIDALARKYEEWSKSDRCLHVAKSRGDTDARLRLGRMNVIEQHNGPFSALPWGDSEKFAAVLSFLQAIERKELKKDDGLPEWKRLRFLTWGEVSFADVRAALRLHPLGGRAMKAVRNTLAIVQGDETRAQFDADLLRLRDTLSQKFSLGSRGPVYLAKNSFLKTPAHLAEEVLRLAVGGDTGHEGALGHVRDRAIAAEMRKDLRPKMRLLVCLKKKFSPGRRERKARRRLCGTLFVARKDSTPPVCESCRRAALRA